MSEARIYRLLEVPWVFRLQRSLLAPGVERAFTEKITELLPALGPATRIVDIGCGPASWLFGAGLHPIGVDRSRSYVRAYAGHGEQATVASADALPFVSGSLDGVWSIGLLHHLPDVVAAAAVREMLRVCAAAGYVAVIDAVLPESAWRRPLAYVLRRLDRGRYVRSEPALRRLFPPDLGWQFQRFTLAATGLEAVVCWSRSPATIQ